MLRIKRSKGGPAGTAINYATSVQPDGSISGWSQEAIAAVAVTETVAQRVRDYYRGKANVGRLDFEPVEVTGEVLAKAVAADDGVGATNFAKLQAECKRLLADNAELRKKAAAAVAETEAADQREKKAVQRALQLEESLTVKEKQAAALTARVAELEQARAEADKQPKAEAKPHHKK